MRECRVSRREALVGVEGRAKRGGSREGVSKRGGMAGVRLLGFVWCACSAGVSWASESSVVMLAVSSAVHVEQTGLLKPGRTFSVQPTLAHGFRPGVFAVVGVLASSIGLLVPAHKVLDARLTCLVHVGDRLIEGSATVGLIEGLESDRLVSRKLGEGSSVGTVGRSLGVACGVGFGVMVGVGGKSKLKPSGNRFGGRRKCGGSFGRRRRNVLHSVQVHDMFRRESVVSILWA